MSAYLALLNQNKVLEAKGITTAVTGASNEIYITLGPWSNYATLNRIVVLASTSMSSLEVDVLSDAAQYRANGNAYLVTQLTSTTTGTFFEFNDIGVMVHDINRDSVLHLRLHATSLPTGATFTVLAQGTPRVSTKLDDVDTSIFRTDPNYKVLLLPSGATVATDVTALFKGNAWQGANNTTVVGFNNVADAIYIGSTTPFVNLRAQVNTNSLQVAGKQFLFKYWNGAWANSNALDNTSDGQATPSNFSYPTGVIEIPSHADWATSQLSFDPYVIMMNAITSGTAAPIGMSYNPARYWMQIIPNTGWTGTCNIVSILPTNPNSV